MTASKKKHLWQNRRFTGMVAGNFLLVATAFILLMGGTVLVSHAVTVRHIREQQSDMNTANLKKQVLQAENEIRGIRLMLIQLTQDIDVKSYFQEGLLHPNTYELLEIRTRVMTSLRNKCLVNRALDRVYIYNDEQQEIVSSDDGTIPSLIYSDQEWRMLFAQLLENGRLDPVCRVDPTSNVSIITLVYQFPVLLSDCQGAIIANVNSQRLFDQTIGNGIYFVTDETDRVVCSSNHLANLQQLSKDDVSPEARRAEGTYEITYQGRAALLSVQRSAYYGWWFYTIDTMESFNTRTGGYTRAILSIGAAGLLLALAFSYLLSVRMFLPVKKILYILEERSDEMILPMESRSESRNEIAFLADTVLHTLNRNKELTQSLALRLEKLNHVRLRMLQSQINPHFLYNALASLNWIVLESLPDDNEISDALCTLSELLRTSLKNPTFVPLSVELEQVKRYVMLQRLCFADAISLETDLQPGVENAAVPSMLLQPLLENAVKHGLDREKNEHLHMMIAARSMDGKQLILTVTNDGMGVSNEELLRIEKAMREELPAPMTAIGLNNVYQQLTLLFSSEAKITLSSPGKIGFQVKICIPYLQKNDLSEK